MDKENFRKGLIDKEYTPEDADEYINKHQWLFMTKEERTKLLEPSQHIHNIETYNRTLPPPSPPNSDKKEKQGEIILWVIMAGVFLVGVAGAKYIGDIVFINLIFLPIAAVIIRLVARRKK